MGVHLYLYSDDVVEVDCPLGSGNSSGQRKALCHAISDADGKFTFKSIPCGNSIPNVNSVYAVYIITSKLKMHSGKLWIASNLVILVTVEFVSFTSVLPESCITLFFLCLN